MSIRFEIDARVKEGRLFLLVPSAPGLTLRRPLLMTEEVKLAMDSKEHKTTDLERFSRLRADLEVFVIGSFLDPKYLKKLKKTEEVWTIRSVRPKPSLRVFGRFAEYDVLIVTHYHDRKSLHDRNSREWSSEIRRCKAEWRKLFPSYEPHSGGTIHDYVSNAADHHLFSK